jgi:cobalamin biosynthesis protein CobT
MLDQETLRPVIVAMSLYLVISKIAPEVFKKPTNVKFIDDIVAMLIMQRGSLMSGAILTGIITYLTNYIIDEFL